VTPHPVTVMIIDDENHMRRLIGRMLEGGGFKVIEAGSGEEALAMLADPAYRPDIITCDISMPDMDGFETLQQIKGNPALADIPVVMLTAMGQLGEAGRAKEMGAGNYITKPFSAISLIDTLNEQVKKP
jgi:diguanylate cyclase